MAKLRPFEVEITCPFCYAKQDFPFDCSESGQGSFWEEAECDKCGKAFQIESELNYEAVGVRPRERKDDRRKQDERSSRESTAR